MPRPARERRERSGHRGRLILAIVIGVLLVLALSMRAIATFWTDFLWFDDLGFSSVWTRLLSAKVSLAVVATIGFFLLAWVNLLLAERFSPDLATMAVDDEVLDRYQSAVAGRQRLILFVVALAVALIPGIGAAGEWQTWLLFRFGGSFGVDDPQFSTDIGFYVFKLPFLSLVVDWVFGFLLVTLVLVIALYYLNGAIRLQSSGERISSNAKAHLSVILALLALVKAVDYWLQRFELTLQRRDSFDGAGYTAVNANLPALQLLILVALFAAVLFVINIRRRGWVLPAIAIALWVVTSIAVAGIYPAFVQRFQVSPAELNRETPYIERNIEATRVAFGLDDVSDNDLRYDPEITPEKIEPQQANLDLARLLDPARIPTTIQSLQFGRQYYEFRDVDVDRYVLGDGTESSGDGSSEDSGGDGGTDGEGGGEPSDGAAAAGTEATPPGSPTPVVISTRELRLGGIAAPVTWEKEHLVFTHGYAAAVAPANLANARGEPDFIVKNIPVESDGLPPLERPEIYVGEGMSGYAIVDTRQEEITQDDLTTSYEGSTGVDVGGFLRKAAFSLRFGQIDPLISDLLTEDSRIIYNRDAVERVALIAPYLTLDPDPYPVIIDGRLVYVVDGYTTTGKYPYGEQIDIQQVDDAAGGSTYNYIRNSVKAVVDAYDGTVTLYLSDTLYGEQDPIIRAYAKAFPGLFDDELPAELMEHLRYPEFLFKTQTQIWGRYHQDSPSTFFNNSDQWDIAQDPPSEGDLSTAAQSLAAERTGLQEFARIDPYYQMIQLTPDRDPEFLLTRPFVLASTDDTGRNLTSIMIAHNDPGSYGRLEQVVIQASDAAEGEAATTNQVDGPLQASEKIGIYRPVSDYQTLVGQRGSKVTFGNLLILPFGDSLLYLRPVYASQEQAGLNTVQRVAVTSGGVVGFGRTVDEAMADLLDGDDSGAVANPDVSEPEIEPPADGEEEPEEPSTPPADGDATPEELLARADSLFDDADAALEAGDLGRYQDLVDQAREELDRALAALGG